MDSEIGTEEKFLSRPLLSPENNKRKIILTTPHHLRVNTFSVP